MNTINKIKKEYTLEEKLEIGSAYIRGISVADIISRYNISQGYVYKIINEFKIPSKKDLQELDLQREWMAKIAELKKQNLVLDEKQICQDYIEGKPVTYMVQKFNITNAQIKNILFKNKISLRFDLIKNPKTRDALIVQLYKSGCSPEEICSILLLKKVIIEKALTNIEISEKAEKLSLSQLKNTQDVLGNKILSLENTIKEHDMKIVYLNQKLKLTLDLKKKEKISLKYHNDLLHKIKIQIKEQSYDDKILRLQNLLKDPKNKLFYYNDLILKFEYDGDVTITTDDAIDIYNNKELPELFKNITLFKMQETK